MMLRRHNETRGDTLNEDDVESGRIHDKQMPLLSRNRVSVYFRWIVVAIALYSLFIWMERGLGSITPEEHHPHHHILEKYTVAINTFERPEMLADAVEHYSKCSKVKHIHIVWSEKAPPTNKFIESCAQRSNPSVRGIP
jgi:hypothetical protein